jgi:peptide/nickel transport system ATP-binding protein
MRQRVMIAMALINDPKLIIADEPTTALDVTVQAQILDLITRLQKEFNAAVVMITHDLGVVAQITDEIAVMYAGRIVEHASTESMFAKPDHPYTWGLLGSIARLDQPAGQELVPIPGRPPSLINKPSGCAFHPRCPYASEGCAVREPLLLPVPSQHRHEVACMLPPTLRDAISAQLADGSTPDQIVEGLELTIDPDLGRLPADALVATLSGDVDGGAESTPDSTEGDD